MYKLIKSFFVKTTKLLQGFIYDKMIYILLGSQGPFSPASHQRMGSRPGDYYNDSMQGTTMLSDFLPTLGGSYGENQ